MKWLDRYLKGTKDKGTILRPNRDKGSEVFVDADFAGNWDPNEYEDCDTARSSQDMATTSPTQDVLYFGNPNCKQKLHFHRLNPNTMECLMRYEMQ